MARPAAVLFDLDGTLVDSAPDLAGTANDMRASRGLAPLPYAQLRPHAGSGARGMLSAAFEVRPGHAGYEALRDEFHQLYELRMTRESALFAAIEGLLSALSRFIRPSELARWCRDAGLGAQASRGLEYNPLTRRYWLSGDTSVNYLVGCQKPG